MAFDHDSLSIRSGFLASSTLVELFIPSRDVLASSFRPQSELPGLEAIEFLAEKLSVFFTSFLDR